MSSSTVVGIICLVMALISALRARSKPDDEKWQKILAIVFLIFGIILVVVPLL